MNGGAGREEGECIDVGACVEAPVVLLHSVDSCCLHLPICAKQALKLQPLHAGSLRPFFREAAACWYARQCLRKHLHQQLLQQAGQLANCGSMVCSPVGSSHRCQQLIKAPSALLQLLLLILPKKVRRHVPQ